MAHQERIEELDREALLGYIEEMRKSLRKITHDLSNPLGIVRMAVYFLQTVKPDEEKRNEYLTTVNEAIDRLDNHVKSLRELADGADNRTSSEGRNP
ncbi:MAG: hypothetical protein IT282_16295 [Bacteroidetes bacterium]|nr:hypothetical protein [Bacteroidota bacterium]